MLTFSTPWTKTDLTPRNWQREAFEMVAQHYGRAPSPASVVRAIMGSGKSILIAEVAARVELPPKSVVVVSTPTELLVQQLYADIGARCRTFERTAGLWYGKRKRLGQVIIACIPSVKSLAERLHQNGTKVALWIADEAHKTECASILEAQDDLAPQHTLGLTATPFRAIESDTLSIFREQIYSYGAKEALRDGVVVPWRIVPWTGEAGTNVDEASIQYIRQAEGPGLANAVDIPNAQNFVAVLERNGIKAGAVYGTQKRDEQKSIIEQCRNGGLKCIVHVNMLSEGANFPWLRWLLLRREVKSRVRFQQEIGRCLRSSPGKTEAVFFDPHDLFGCFSLSVAEALGDPSPKEAAASVPPIQRALAMKKASVAEALTLAEVTIRQLHVACDASGMLPEIHSRPLLTKERRRQRSTSFQRVMLHKNLATAQAHIPMQWQPLMKAVERNIKGIKRGFASDLIAVLGAVSRKQQWPSIDIEGRIHAGVSDACMPN